MKLFINKNKFVLDDLTLSVDNRIYCNIKPNSGFYTTTINGQPVAGSNLWTSKMAPFDKEFYLSLGVGAGGFNDFPDDIDWQVYKPWKNYAVKGLLNFWRTMQPISRWPTDDATMKIDYVRVYAL